MSEPKPVAAYVRQMELNVSPETIREVIRSFTGEQLQISTLPRVYRTALRPALNVLFEDVEYDPFLFVRTARVTYGYTNAEIAKALGVSRGTVSKIYCQDRRELLVPGTN